MVVKGRPGLGNGEVRRQGKPWIWRVVKNGELPAVGELLPAKDRWLRLITSAIARFRNAAGELETA